MQAKAKLTLLSLLLVALAGCPSKKPKYPSCDGDKDCQNAEKCVNKRCVQCGADSDCKAGQQCVNGACDPIPGWCSADGDCPNGEVCKGNKCMPCASDDECGPGGRCRDGRCLRKGQCSADTDCAEDEDCVKGVCVKGGAQTNPNDLPKCTLGAVYFDFDASTLKEESKPVLQKNAECLSSTPREVSVIGQTDPRGTDEYNIALSDQRARIVSDYLSRLGIDPSRMHVVPKGEADASGVDEDSWARDRRVEFQWK